MDNPYNNKELQKEIKQIIKEGIKQGIEAKEAPGREQQKFQSNVMKMAAENRIIK